MTADAWVLGTLRPLDAVRVGLFRLTGPLGRRLAVDRGFRISVALTVGLLVALGLTLTAPALLLAWSPLVLGVPHLVSDVRSLVLRPGLHRHVGSFLGLGIACVVGAMGETALGTGLGLGLGVVLSDARIGWNLLGIVIVAPIAAWLASASMAPIVVAHVHNVLAIALAVAWSPIGRRSMRVPVLTVLLGLAGLALLPADPTLATHAARLAPGLDGTLATFAVTSFAFLQAAHYGVWLRAIPDLDRPRETPRSFRSSWNSLRSETGALPFLALAAGLSLFMWGLVDVAAADDAYFRLALFHGPLEAFAIGRWCVRGPS